MKLYFKKMVHGVVEVDGETLEEVIDNYYGTDTVALLEDSEWFESLTEIVKEEKED